MHKMNIKPLSVNQAWQGKRFKTPKYKAYEKELLLTLPKLSVSGNKLVVRLEFGFSNIGADIDNGIKPFLDILQKKYDFNDNKIFRMEVEKVKVEKGFEYIHFQIKDMYRYGGTK